MYRKPYRVKKKKSILRSRVFWQGILGLILAGELFYFFIFSDFFQIKQVNISGEKKVSKAEIISVIEKETAKNILLIDLDKTKEKIFQEFPKIAEIKIKRKLPDALNLVISEREGVVIFCQSDNCFLLDKEGIIFAPMVEEIKLLKIRKTEIESLLDLKLGERVLEEILVSSVLEIKFKLDDLKILLAEFVIISDDRLNVKTLEGWEIYFDPKGNLTWQITKLKAVLKQEIPTEKRKNLEYIELRFGNLAPYKYR